MSTVILLLTGVRKELQNIDSCSIKKLTFLQFIKLNAVKEKLKLTLSARRRSHVGAVHQVC